MHITHIIKKHAKSIGIVLVSAVVCGSIAGVVFRFAMPQEYSSQMQILVIQKYTLTDSYTASKSAEKVSQNLGEVVKTSSFLEDVVASKKVDLQDLLQLNESDRRDEWEKTLDTEVVPNASILKITAYDVNPSHAEQIVNAVSDVLIEKGSDYHGAPDTISLKVVDTALTSTYPTRPNILLNGSAAAVFGGLCAAVVLFLMTPKSAKQHGNGFAQSAQRVNHTVVTQQPGKPVHTQQPAMPEEQKYAVLHVANFQNHLPSAKHQDQDQ